MFSIFKKEARVIQKLIANKMRKMGYLQSCLPKTKPQIACPSLTHLQLRSKSTSMLDLSANAAPKDRELPNLPQIPALRPAFRKGRFNKYGGCRR
jgi:hypothetical protein